MARRHDRDEHKESLIGSLIEKEPIVNRRVTGLNRSRLTLGFGILLLFFLALIFKMGWIQIVKADEYREKATAIQTLDTDIDSTRGIIYDSKGNVLAETNTQYELLGYTAYLYKKKDSDEKKLTIDKLSKITGKTPEELRGILKDKENVVSIAKGLSSDQVKKAEKAFGDTVIVKTTPVRYYPNGAFASQILGNLSSDGKATSGLELEYNTELAGTKGRAVKKTDRDGNTVSNGFSRSYKAEDGYNLETTIDSAIQNYVEDALEKGMERTGATSITCIVMNPKTGDILAYAENPEYDPNKPGVPSDPKARAAFNKMSDAEKNEYINGLWKIEAVSSVYEPGSTFKLVAASAGLELGTVTDASRYYCNGTINVDGTVLHCTGVHGTQDIKHAVGNSCNPGLAKVALTMGSQGFYQYIKLYGLTKTTGVDLPGESSSIVKDRSTLTGVDLATLGYGQGIAVTPIQLLTAVNAMGNDGILMKPKIVKRITDSDGNVVEEVGDTAVRQVITKETADKMREIMEFYVSSAGGTKAYVPGYRIGGKTGTANIASGGSYSASTDTSFVAMAPMDDPVISMLVIVHKPTKMSYGNNTAGPIIKEIMSKALPYLGVEKTTGSSAAEKAMIEIPNVTGMDSKKAIELIKSKGFKYVIEPQGTGDKAFVVQDQYPKAGTKKPKGSSIHIYSE